MVRPREPLIQRPEMARSARCVTSPRLTRLLSLPQPNPRGRTHSSAAIRVRATMLPMDEARLNETPDGSLVSPSGETCNRTPEGIRRRNGNAYIAAGASGFGHTTTVSRRDRAPRFSDGGKRLSHSGSVPLTCH